MGEDGRGQVLKMWRTGRQHIMRFLARATMCEPRVRRWCEQGLKRYTLRAVMAAWVLCAGAWCGLAAASDAFYVVLGSFQQESKAREAAQDARTAFEIKVSVAAAETATGERRFRVLAGPWASHAEAAGIRGGGSKARALKVPGLSSNRRWRNLSSLCRSRLRRSVARNL